MGCSWSLGQRYRVCLASTSWEKQYIIVVSQSYCTKKVQVSVLLLLLPPISSSTFCRCNTNSYSEHTAFISVIDIKQHLPSSVFFSTQGQQKQAVNMICYHLVKLIWQTVNWQVQSNISFHCGEEKSNIHSFKLCVGLHPLLSEISCYHVHQVVASGVYLFFGAEQEADSESEK